MKKSPMAVREPIRSEFTEILCGILLELFPFNPFYSVSPVLRQAALNYMSDSDCFDLYQNANLDTTDDMQCFGTRQSSSPHQDWIAGH